MEYTGIYNLPLVKWLKKQSALIWMESGTQISKSQGLVRGKNDKVDSSRIALYAFSNRHNIKLWKAPREIIEKLSVLLSLRNRFIKAKKQLSVTIEEQKLYLDKNTIKTLKKLNADPVNELMKSIQKVEKEIMELIKTDERIFRIYKIATSIDGIGMITAVNLITTTNEFLSITEAKKYACYSGVAPFEHSSGSSVRGKTKVSHMANKKTKTLLHLAALSAIQVKGEIKEYYKRKVEQGKNKMSVLNAVRNKIIQRVFACVKQDRFFEKNYQFNLVKP
jgi:transposase